MLPLILSSSSLKISLHSPHCGISTKERRYTFVDKQEFSFIRRQLVKTQSQMAKLLGTSLKAIQSFEQGWRNIPVHIERQMLFLFAMKRNQEGKRKPCWIINKCPMKIKKTCPSWEFHSGHLCWFINGTICHGQAQENWSEKMASCRNCTVFRSIFPALNNLP